MSLINDALKRAKQAHQAHPAPRPDLPFRPAGPSPGRQVGFPMWLLVAALAILLLGGLLMVVALRSGEPKPRLVNATPAGDSTRQTSLAAVPSLEIQPDPVRSGLPETPSGSASATALPEVTVQPVTASVPSGPNEGPATKIAPATESDPGNATLDPATGTAVAELPKPPKPKLQGIFYNPSRPSAVVNGKTVYLGGSVGEFRVLAIRPESVVLGNASQTNVLHLEP